MRQAARQKLKLATGAALVAVSYIFVTRTIGTIIPSVFRNLAVAQVSTIVSLAASVTMLLFFVIFYSHYVRKDQSQLAGATLLSILGRCGMLLLHIKMLLGVFGIYALTNFVYNYQFIDRFFPWVSSLFMTVFFCVFYRELMDSNKIQLRSATLLAALGSLVITLMQTFFLLHYLLARSTVPLMSIARFISIAFYAVIVLNFFVTLFFFASFYRSIDAEPLLHQSAPASSARTAAP